MLKNYFKNSAILLLLQRMIMSPGRIGAIVPSSKHLATYMAREALKNLKGPEDFVLEIGAGTGCITHALLDQGLAPEKLICLELDPQLYRHLIRKYPKVHIIQGDASHLVQLIEPDKHGKISSIVSGIPMRNLSSAAKALIIQALLGILSPDGSILQFTYGWIPPIFVPGFEGTKLRRIYANLPPAAVWSYQKAPVK